MVLDQMNALAMQNWDHVQVRRSEFSSPCSSQSFQPMAVRLFKTEQTSNGISPYRFLSGETMVSGRTVSLSREGRVSWR